MKKKYRYLMLTFFIGFLISITAFVSCLLAYLNDEKKMVIEKNTPEEISFVPTDLVFNSMDDSLYLESMIPTLDKFGVLEKGFSFSIKNNNAREIKYELSLFDDNSTIKNSNVRYQLIKNNQKIGIYSLNEEGIIEIGWIKENEEVDYTIKLWLDYNSEVKVGRLSKKIMIKELTDDEDTIINKPVLTDGLIPVYYDNNTNSWHKADDNNVNSNWYSYQEQKWANAVTVIKDKRSFYQESDVGTIIETGDINSMWVWIPRFNYTITDEDININFVNIDSKADLAFTFNNTEIEGFWFTKFESGMKEDSECITSSLTKSCNNSNNHLYFVPNYPFTNKMTMANIFYAIRKMELKNNIYGFNGTGTKVNNDGTIKSDSNNIDTHMIKNIEWQAVALLSSSKYGKTGNNNYENDQKIIANNNSLLTGKTNFENNQYDYNVLFKGEAGSTTGNVTGIYDMSGGKREYVMLNNSDINIFNKKSNSGFTTSVKEYYYDNGFMDNDTTLKLKNKYSDDNQINNEPLTRGGYKNTGNIFNIYGNTDYINKISVETNSRACLVILKENSNNEEKKES